MLQRELQRSSLINIPSKENKKIEGNDKKETYARSLTPLYTYKPDLLPYYEQSSGSAQRAILLLLPYTASTQDNIPHPLGRISTPSVCSTTGRVQQTSDVRVYGKTSTRSSQPRHFCCVCPSSFGGTRLRNSSQDVRYLANLCSVGFEDSRYGYGSLRELNRSSGYGY